MTIALCIGLGSSSSVDYENLEHLTPSTTIIFCLSVRGRATTSTSMPLKWGIKARKTKRYNETRYDNGRQVSCLSH
eukprot:scaffold1525_cov142-Cylindrotheca_fusiformis.AAC.139